MLYFKISLLIYALFSLVESSSFKFGKYWYLTCSSSACTGAINSCLNCLGERMCKFCLTNANAACSTCADDIFNKDDLETVQGEQFLLCQNEDSFEAKICHFYCRGKSSQFGQCVKYQNIPVCQCTNTTVSTTTNTITTFTTTNNYSIINKPFYNSNSSTLLKIQNINGQKIFPLRNGDFIKSGEGIYSNIQIYDSYTGKIKRNLTGPHTYAYDFGQLSNGDLIAAYRYNMTFVVWDLNALNENSLKRVIKLDDYVYSLIVLKNDDLAYGLSDYGKYAILVTDSINGLVKKKLIGHTSTIYQIIEHENGNLLSCSWDRTVKIWNITSDTSLVKSINHSLPIQSIAILANGNLASGLNNGNIEIRNLDTGDLIRTLKGHTNDICYTNCLRVLNNGDLLSASRDWTIRVWNTDSGDVKLINNQHQTTIYQIEFLPSGNLISVSMKEIFIWS